MDIEKCVYSGKYPIKLCTNRVWRTYTGGKLLDEWKGLNETSDSHFPEEWISSLVFARNPNRECIRNEGLSTVEVQPGEKIYLKRIIESNPELFLGKKHVETHGSNTGVLVKVLDSHERLTIQVHPDKETAKRIFGSEYGKAEAWYIIGGREINSEPPYILFGFKSGITRQNWEKMFWEQNIQGLIDSMHKFYVKPGQVFLIEGGIPHAIGPGCFLIEIQEPTDYTIRVEKKTPSGLELSDFLCHQGVGFDKMFECFKFDEYSSNEILERWRLSGDESNESSKAPEKVLISYENTPYFSMNSIEVENEHMLENCDSFSTIVILDGCGKIEWNNDKIKIVRGDQIFLPINVKNIICKSTGNIPLTILRCFPPKS